MMAAKDYYAVLGVTREAHPDVVKAAYFAFLRYAGRGDPDVALLIRATLLEGSVLAVPSMFRVPLWTGPPHVMQFGPIGMERAVDQLVAARHDPVQAMTDRCE
jgi:hypothetical protein